MYSNYLIVFQKAKTLGVIRRLLHKEISHCFILIKEGSHWIKYDTNIDTVDICTIKTLDDIITESYKVISVNKSQINGGFFAINTCVGAVKRFIGLRSPFILTPYQLFKRLESWDY